MRQLLSKKVLYMLNNCGHTYVMTSGYAEKRIYVWICVRSNKSVAILKGWFSGNSIIELSIKIF